MPRVNIGNRTRKILNISSTGQVYKDALIIMGLDNMH